MAYKVESFGLLNLDKYTSTLIRSEVCGVERDFKSVRACHSDPVSSGRIELGHALDFIEADKVAVFQSMSRFIKTGNRCFFFL